MDGSLEKGETSLEFREGEVRREEGTRTDMVVTRKELLEREERELCPWGTSSARSRGRRWEEEPDPFRTCFLRDRDRILHSAAFRRLQSKTQVLAVSQGDYFRTRLTHTLEVFQMAQSAAVALGLNSDLAQALALGHDLGHPPFGHAGERALARLMEGKGGFSHNAQAARIVDELEHRNPAYPGLNLTFETRRGLLKHLPPPEFPLARDLRESLEAPPPMEALLVDQTDQAAYLHHDLDDVLRMGLVRTGEAEELRLWKEAREELEAQGRGGRGKGFVTLVLARMIKKVNQDLIRETARRLEEAPVQGPPPRPGLSREVEGLLEELREFLLHRFYRNPKVMEAMERAEGTIERLFEEYLADPGKLPEDFRARMDRDGPERTVCDYLAGMTDRLLWTRAGMGPEAFMAR